MCFYLFLNQPVSSIDTYISTIVNKCIFLMNMYQRKHILPCLKVFLSQADFGGILNICSTNILKNGGRGLDLIAVMASFSLACIKLFSQAGKKKKVTYTNNCIVQQRDLKDAIFWFIRPSGMYPDGWNFLLGIRRLVFWDLWKKRRRNERWMSYSTAYDYITLSILHNIWRICFLFFKTIKINTSFVSWGSHLWE